MNGFDVWNKIIFMFAAQRQYTHTPCGNNNNILDASPVKWNAVCVVRSGGAAAAAAAHRCRRPPLREAINRESRLLNAHCGSLRFFLSRNTHTYWLSQKLRAADARRTPNGNKRGGFHTMPRISLPINWLTG
jgi:hypothetical protein